ncbi:MAG: hypothetical protein ACK4Q4_00690 [Rhodocyclaceae bacterium]
MTLDQIKEWATLGNLVLPFFMGGVLFWLNKHYVRRSEHNDIVGKMTKAIEHLGERQQSHAERLNQGDTRFNLLDERIKALPSAADIAQLAVSMERLSGDIRVTNAKFEGMDALMTTVKGWVSVIDDHLRSKDK